MSTYKLIGQRFLRKYTATNATPVYAAAADAQRVASSLCEVDWDKVSARDATMPYHTEEVINPDAEGNGTTGLDMNPSIRDLFDAALFCAGHVGGQHRAYANAAVYRFELPTAAVGLSLSSLSVILTSDPYNSQGARIHVFTNSTGVIPTACRTLRGDDASGVMVEDGSSAAAAAKRTATTSSGKTYWYPTTETVTLSPSSLTLQKYLFVAVLLESYSTVRGNWLEGSSFIDNNVTVTTSSAVSGWSDGDTIDCRNIDPATFEILKDGVLPTMPSALRQVSVRADADPLVNPDGSQCDMRSAAGVKAAAALSRLYAAFFDAASDDAQPDALSTGASFNVSRLAENHVAPNADAYLSTDLLRITSQVLVVPFVWPRDFTPSSVRLDFSTLSLSSGARFNVFLASSTTYMTSLNASALKNPGLYDASNPPFTLVGSVTSGTTATLDLPSTERGREGTFVISAYFPPENYDLSSGGSQGTGSTPFLPNITLVE